jgi:hypothetical protein
MDVEIFETLHVNCIFNFFNHHLKIKNANLTLLAFNIFYLCSGFNDILKQIVLKKIVC